MAQPAGPRARALFVRETPDVRRQALIDATARCLAEKGIGGTSVRAICARAGVSSGLLTHYFPGVDALILATYVDVGARVSAALDAAIASAGNDPRDRLRACLLANLRPPVLDPDLLATWIAFWSLVTSDPAIAAVHADVYGGTRHQLETLLGEAAPQLSQAQKRIAAISLTALVDGLWLELCLDRSSFTAEEAQAMAESAMMQWLGANDEQVDKSGAL
jgi:TetR/AcrR family transcriptional regulator, transcriptional repressor of bet genes